MSMLRVYSEIPDGFFSLSSPREIGQIFSGPSLLDLAGAAGRGTLFLSGLIHGNETTAFFVLQKFLKRRRQALAQQAAGPRLLLFFGNVQAAIQGLRQLPDCVDYNRIWGDYLGPKSGWVSEVLAYVKSVAPFAALDIHNTSGKNPLFSCLTRLDQAHLAMAKVFCPRVFFFSGPSSVLSVQLAQICPALTLECGQSGNQEGAERALLLVEKLYASGPEFVREFAPALSSELEVFECFGQMKIGGHWALSFDQHSENTVQLNKELEHFNFQNLAIGQLLARGGDREALEFSNLEGVDLGPELVEFKNGEWRAKTSFIPAMVSSDLSIIRSDCWGYLMSRKQILS